LRVTHVFVVTTQFFRDISRGLAGLRDRTLLAQHVQQVAEHRAQIVMNARHRRRTVAASPVVDEELLDRVLVRNPHRQVAPCHPGGEVGDARDVALDSSGGLAPASQIGGECPGGPVRFGPWAQGLFVRDPDRNVIELHQRGWLQSRCR
jgi:hypothetical protein